MPEKKVRLDLVGTALSAAGLGLIVFGILRSGTWGFVKPKPANGKKLGKGFKNIEKIDNWIGSASWADLIFSTSNDDYLEKLEFFRKKGYPVFAPSPASAKQRVPRYAASSPSRATAWSACLRALG